MATQAPRPLVLYRDDPMMVGEWMFALRFTMSHVLEVTRGLVHRSFRIDEIPPGLPNMAIVTEDGTRLCTVVLRHERTLMLNDSDAVLVTAHAATTR